MSLPDLLASYRASHPPVAVDRDGVSWRYARGGSGTECVLLLGGALGIGEMAFPVISRLERERRVIAPDYPAVRRVAPLLEGIAAILDAEGIAAAHVVGASFGGLVAQAFTRRYPGRVASLVLSHTSVPDPKRMGRVPLRIASMMPIFLLRPAMARRLEGLLAGTDPFWRAYIQRSWAGLPASDLRARLHQAAAFSIEGPYGPGDLDAWGRRILILESDDDPLAKPESRAALRAAYPGARVHVFHGTGHATPLLDPEGYAGVLMAFLGESS